MIDNYEIEEIMEILENYENEELAVQYLREFNDKTSYLGRLLMNLDKNLSNDEWKVLCDKAKKDVDAVVQKIRNNR